MVNIRHTGKNRMAHWLCRGRCKLIIVSLKTCEQKGRITKYNLPLKGRQWTYNLNTFYTSPLKLNGTKIWWMRTLRWDPVLWERWDIDQQIKHRFLKYPWVGLVKMNIFCTTFWHILTQMSPFQLWCKMFSVKSSAWKIYEKGTSAFFHPVYATSTHVRFSQLSII